MDEIKEILTIEASSIKTQEDLKEFFIKYGLLNNSSGSFQGYGIIRIDGNGCMTNDSWNIGFDEFFAGHPRALQFSVDVQGYNEESKLYDMSVTESYAVYILAENDTLLLTMKNSQKPGWGYKMLKEFEKTARERHSPYMSIMMARRELDQYLKRIGYIPFREIQFEFWQDATNKKCYRKVI